MIEEHKDHKNHKEQHVEHKSKNFRNLLIAASVIIVLFVVSIASMSMFSAPGLKPITGQNTVQSQQFTTSGDEMVAKQVTENLPYYESVQLVPGRYRLEVTTGSKVSMIDVFTDAQFQMWNSGNWPTPKLSSGYSTASSVDSFTGGFDVNTGEGGTYYIVIEGNGQTSINMRLVQVLKF
jgi:hypothetical protein